MSSKFFKTTPEFKQPSLNVDRENGIIKNVVIVQQGANKNGSYFNSQFLTDLVASGNAQTQGVKSRFGHPNMCSTSLGSFIGRYKNFSEKEGKVYADLHLDQITKKTQVEGKGISMWEYIIEMADNNPDMFGNSIHIKSEEFEEDVEGSKVISHKFESLVASDLVDSPAATDSLFDDSEDLGVIVTHFLDSNPELFDTVQKNPAIIEDFFGRYATYLKSKSLTNFDMSFLKKLKEKFSTNETFDLDITLATGDIVTVVTEGEEPKAGDKVNDKDGKPVADGEHLTADGSTLVVAGGEITEIKPKEESTDPPAEPTLTEVMQGVTLLGTQFKAFQATFSKENKETREGLEFVAEQFGTLDKRVTEMGKGIKSKYDAPPTPEGGKGKKEGDSTYDADAVREAREALKNKK